MRPTSGTQACARNVSFAHHQYGSGMNRFNPRFVAILPLILIALAVPAGVQAGSCPSDPNDLLPRTTYRVGEVLDFYGNYTDFADPGTVTISFTRPADGATRAFTAGNLPDGSWFQLVTFTDRADSGSWRVHVVVEQTSGTSSCDDRFTLTAAAGSNPTPPPTSTEPLPGGSTAPTAGLAIGAAGLAAFLALLIGVPRRGRGGRHRR